MKRFFLVLILTGFAAFAFIYWFGYPRYGIDDANIGFVYSNHIGHGKGFVYNIGGERVEGTSCLLWIFIGAIAFKISPDPELFLLIINIVIASLGITTALTSIHFLFSEETKRKKTLLEISFLLLIYMMPAFLLWTTVSLMENALWSTLLVTASFLLLKDNPQQVRHTNRVFSLLAVLIMLTRPESLLWVPLLIALFYSTRRNILDARNATKTILPLLLVYVFMVIALTAFRLLYFGYPFPNTFYAKISPSLLYNLNEGIRYLTAYAYSRLPVGLCVWAVVAVLLHTIAHLISSKGRIQEKPLALSIIAGTGLMLPVATGGDHFVSFRFFQNVWPILVLNLLYFLFKLLPQYLSITWNPKVSRTRRLFLQSCILGFLLLAFSRGWYYWQLNSDMMKEFTLTLAGRSLGQSMTDMFSTLPALPRVGVVAAGGVKVSYEGEIVDVMGINNVQVAHNGGNRFGFKNHAAFEKNSFYALHPDIFLPESVSAISWSYSVGSGRPGWATSAFKGVLDDSQFLDSYVYARISDIEHKKQFAIAGWMSKDFLSVVRSYGYKIETYTQQK